MLSRLLRHALISLVYKYKIVWNVLYVWENFNISKVNKEYVGFIFRHPVVGRRRKNEVGNLYYFALILVYLLGYCGNFDQQFISAQISLLLPAAIHQHST